MASLVLGIVGLFFTLIGLVPFLGFINWISIILLGIGLVLGIIGAKKKQGVAIAGLIICIVFLVIASWRLYVGIVAANAFANAATELLQEGIKNMQ